ncbi:MAG: ATP-binding protein [Pseudomonadota bacterium]
MSSARWSLRGRLIALLAAAAIASWAAGGLWLYRSSLAESDRLFDAALVETAHAVLAVVAHEWLEEDDDEIELEVVDHTHAETLFYQVRSGGGRLVYRSPGAPAEPFDDARAQGFATRRVAGTDYRVYSLQAPRRRGSIHVAQPLAARGAAAQAAALRLLAPGLVFALLLAAGVWLIVRRVTAPVVGFSQAIDARTPGDATPVRLDALPEELAPVGHAVNRLLARVDEALRHERTLTADAAHELRTPLAALRAQAQVALRARADAERSEALRELIGGVDRAARAVESVLTLARLDAERIDVAALPAVRLDGLARLVAAEFDAAARGVALELDVPALEVRGDADALAILLRNLLDNALRHAAGRVRVQARALDHAIALTVADDGPGMPAEQRSRAFDRFYRGAEGGGAGLGLALVKRIAALHGGDASFVDGLGGRGLGVEVVLAR